MTKLRWLGTAAYLLGMALTAANVYPANLVFGAIGGACWTVVGAVWKDRALTLVEAASVMIYSTGLFAWAYTISHQ